MTSEKTVVDYGVVVAMHSEAVHLLALADRTEELQGITYDTWKCEFGESTALVVVSGIGMVLSAAATERLISTFHPQYILNFGCTGAHRPDINLGDVVIGNKGVAHYNIQLLSDGTAHHVGFITEQGRDLVHVTKENYAEVSLRLVEVAKDAMSRREIEPWPGASEAPRWHLGPIASADVWTQELQSLNVFHAEHGTLCEDMEAAAIGKIANLHSIPYLTIKDISNNEFQKHTNLADFQEFPFEEVGKRAARVVADVILASSVEEYR